MSDLIDDENTGNNAPEYTVTEISGAIKRTIEGEFGRVRVRGEIGRVSRPRSGHVYLDLKDDRSVLSGVIWKGVASRLATQPEEGLEVIATGKLTTFGGQSKYQIVIDDIAPAGAGALMAMLEKRKAMLAAEGLFAAERKRALPYLPRVIGVITSPSGAVIRDILHRLRDRFARHVLIWPVAVQGQNCASEVARAIKGFNQLSPNGDIPRPDLLIVARGGGSLEDLWGFNEEIVVRAAAASQIPLISAVGHETDTTLIDYVADKRAPTPTAAAEMAVPVRLELLAALESLSGRLSRALAQSLAQRSQRLRDLARVLPRPEALAQPARQRLDLWGERLAPSLRQMVQTKHLALERTAAPLQARSLRQNLNHNQERCAAATARLGTGLGRSVTARRRELSQFSDRLQSSRLLMDIVRKRDNLSRVSQRLQDVMQIFLMRDRDRLSALVRMHHTLGYKETLQRGYAVVRGDGAVVTHKSDARKAAVLEIEFADGKLSLDRRTGTGKKQAAGKAPDQGTLF